MERDGADWPRRELRIRCRLELSLPPEIRKKTHVSTKTTYKDKKKKVMGESWLRGNEKGRDRRAISFKERLRQSREKELDIKEERETCLSLKHYTHSQ